MSTRPNILFLTSNITGGGAENHFLRLVPFLFPDAPSKLAISVIAPKDKIIIDGIDLLTLDRSNRSSYWRIIRKLAEIITERQIDLVYSFSRTANFLAFCSTLFSKKKPLWVAGVNSRPCRAHDLYPSLAGVIRLFAKKWIYPRADLILCNSLSAKEELTERLKIDPANIAIIKNPIPIEEIRAKSLTEPDNECIDGRRFLLSVGRLYEGKGFEDLLDVFHQNKNSIPYDLVIVGDGPLRASLENKINACNMSNRILLPGWFENPFPFFRKAELYITASYWEGLPNTVLEAMALELPVISSLSTSWIDEFSRLGACKSFPVGNKVAMLEKMMEVTSDQNVRENLIKKASGLINQFDVQPVAEERNNHLQKLVQDLK